MTVNAAQITRRYFLRSVTGDEEINPSKTGTYLYHVDSDYVWVHRAKGETRWVAGHKPTRDAVLDKPGVRTSPTDSGTRRLIHVIVIASQSEFCQHVEEGTDPGQLEWYAFPTRELTTYANLSGQTYHISRNSLDEMEHFYQDEIGYLTSKRGYDSGRPRSEWLEEEKFERLRRCR